MKIEVSTKIIYLTAEISTIINDYQATIISETGLIITKTTSTQPEAIMIRDKITQGRFEIITIRG